MEPPGAPRPAKGLGDRFVEHTLKATNGLRTVIGKSDHAERQLRAPVWLTAAVTRFEPKSDLPDEKMWLASLGLLYIGLPISIMVIALASPEPDFVRGAVWGSGSWVVGSVAAAIKGPELRQSSDPKPSFGLWGAALTSVVIAVLVTAESELVPWVISVTVGILGSWVSTSGFIELWARRRQRRVSRRKGVAPSE